MTSKIDRDVDPSVEFLYKTAAQRDPSKRKVKPVEKHLIQVDFGLGDDDSGDSDYNHSGEESEHEEQERDPVKKEESDEIDVEGVEENSEEEEEEEDSEEEDDDDGRPSSADESEEEKSGSLLRHLGEEAYISDDDEDYVPPSERDVSGRDVTKDVSGKVSKATSTAQHVVPRKEDIKIADIEGAVSGRKLQEIVICCVCLGDITQEQDEIVVCDGCGVSVHEGCYGIPDTSSVASTDSSASTEPWFCDACKAGVNPHCELCPNSGGIYKETDAGKWVHIVCALYIPGVAFNDVERLSNVTLFEMPYSKWGAKECSLCEDQRYSQTGVCICCDAGLCRNHFHVTCAQREGLLSEASPEEDIADPFYAYCKQHADKYSMKAKRKNYLAVQSRIKAQQLDGQGQKARLQRKLTQHRKTYGECKVRRPPCWIPTEKMPRPLSSCPNAVRRLNRKAELLGVSTQHNAAAHRDPRKKTGYVPAAFSMEFVSYYMERNIKITQMRARNAELLCQNVKLIEQEKVYRAEYDKLHEERERMKEASGRKAANQLWQILLGASKGKLSLPDILKPKETRVKITSHVASDAPLSPPVNVIHKCGICSKTSDQHLLVRCDLCNKRYHLACLDPPLTRMPKKSKLFGWQCQECSPSTSDESEDEEDTSAPRKLRESIKEPRKLIHEQSHMKDRSKKRPGKRTEVAKGRSTSSDSRHESDSGEVGKSEKTLTDRGEPNFLLSYSVAQKTPTKKKGTAQKRRRVAMMNYSAYVGGAGASLAPTECAMCLKKGNKNDMVRCDECTLCYHFPCLTPPQTKSPKRRGANWLCAACDPNPPKKTPTKRARSPAMSEIKSPTKKSPTKSPPKSSPPPPPPKQRKASPKPKRRASSESEKPTPAKRVKKTPKKYQDGGVLSEDENATKKRKLVAKKVKVETESSDSSSEDEQRKDKKLTQGKVVISRLENLTKVGIKKKSDEERSSPMLAKSRNALSSILMKKEKEEMKKSAKKTPKPKKF